MSAIEFMVQQLSTAKPVPIERPRIPIPKSTGRGHPLSPAVRNEIVRLKLDGLTNQEIAGLCGVGNSTVSRVMTEHRVRRTDDARGD